MSTVCTTSANAAQLFLVDQYAIGQTFQRLEKLPAFELVSVGLGPYNQSECDSVYTNKDYVKSEVLSSGSRELWRRYKLAVPGFDCEIVEVFPDRDMFVCGEAWLDDHSVMNAARADSCQVKKARRMSLISSSASFINMNLLLICGFFLFLFYELTSFIVDVRFSLV
jgi:hypothetical protein